MWILTPSFCNSYQTSNRDDSTTTAVADIDDDHDMMIIIDVGAVVGNGNRTKAMGVCRQYFRGN